MKLCFIFSDHPLSKPNIENPKNLTVEVNDLAEFECRVTSNTPLSVQWIRPESNIPAIGATPKGSILQVPI